MPGFATGIFLQFQCGAKAVILRLIWPCNGRAIPNRGPTEAFVSRHFLRFRARDSVGFYSIPAPEMALARTTGLSAR
jgi:hypothetical protein